jgi:hypothetical protein
MYLLQTLGMETSSTPSSTNYYSTAYGNSIHWFITIIMIPLEALLALEWARLKMTDHFFYDHLCVESFHRKNFTS